MCYAVSLASAQLCVSAHPIFDDPMVHVYMYIRYVLHVHEWFLRVSAHPRFWPINFQVPMGAYSAEYGMYTSMNVWEGRLKVHSVYMCWLS